MKKVKRVKISMEIQGDLDAEWQLRSMTEKDYFKIVDFIDKIAKVPKS